MNRFFVPVGTVRSEPFPIPAPIVHQVRDVLRVRLGEEFVLLEGDGTEARCRLAAANRIELVERRAAGGEPRHQLTVCQALLKGDRLEQVVQHGTELGVARFRLLLAERCVARDVGEQKLARLRAIAREAAEQSERGIVPEVDAPVRLADLLDPGATLLLERYDGRRLRELTPVPSSVLIGPEGGWSDAEVAAAQRAGALFAGLGPRILRSETVALAAAAVILSRTGDFA